MSGAGWDQRRTVGEPAPTFYVVNAAGLVKEISVRGPGGGAVRLVNMTDGRTLPTIAPEYHAMGWRMLEDLYRQDPREDVRKNGMAKFLEHQRAMRRRQPGTRKLGNRRRHRENHNKYDSKEERSYPIEFPDAWLPLRVIELREGRAPTSEKAYKPPKAPKVSGAGASAGSP